MTIAKAWTLVVLLPILTAATGGCTTYRAYEGKRRPPEEIARVAVPWSIAAIDTQPVDGDTVSTVELLPGYRVLEWDFTYPNRYSERKRLEFRAEAGRSYRLTEQFFPAPHPDGLLGAAVDFVVGTALLPATLLTPPPDVAPDGEYYMWITEEGAEPTVVAGLPPNVPLAHIPLTFVPVESDGP